MQANTQRFTFNPIPTFHYMVVHDHTKTTCHSNTMEDIQGDGEAKVQPPLLTTPAAVAE